MKGTIGRSPNTNGDTRGDELVEHDGPGETSAVGPTSPNGLYSGVKAPSGASSRGAGSIRRTTPRSSSRKMCSGFRSP